MYMQTILRSCGNVTAQLRNKTQMTMCTYTQTSRLAQQKGAAANLTTITGQSNVCDHARRADKESACPRPALQQTAMVVIMNVHVHMPNARQNDNDPKVSSHDEIVNYHTDKIHSDNTRVTGALPSAGIWQFACTIFRYESQKTLSDRQASARSTIGGGGMDKQHSQ